ncbi:hypothetical protein GCM10022253_28520 [Sphingomonas endophytica]
MSVDPTHVELDEGAGQLLRLPGGGLLAGAQPHDHVADPPRLPGAERQFAADAVALVEQPQHRDALRHRRGARIDGRLLRVVTHLVGGGRRGDVGQRVGDRLAHDRRLGRRRARAGAQVQPRPGRPRCHHHHQPADRERTLHASGLHAS